MTRVWTSIAVTAACGASLLFGLGSAGAAAQNGIAEAEFIAALNGESDAVKLEQVAGAVCELETKDLPEGVLLVVCDDSRIVRVDFGASVVDHPWFRAIVGGAGLQGDDRQSAINALAGASIKQAQVGPLTIKLEHSAPDLKAVSIAEVEAQPIVDTTTSTASTTTTTSTTTMPPTTPTTAAPPTTPPTSEPATPPTSTDSDGGGGGATDDTQMSLGLLLLAATVVAAMLANVHYRARTDKPYSAPFAWAATSCLLIALVVILTRDNWFVWGFPIVGILCGAWAKLLKDTADERHRNSTLSNGAS